VIAPADPVARSSGATAVHCDALVHVYGSVGQEVTALRGVDLHVGDGEMVALLGPSGAGKSTLLWVLAGLMRPTAGLVQVYERDLRNISSVEATHMRQRQVGVVMQNPARNLLAHETAAGNIMFAQRPARGSHKAKRSRAAGLLEAVGLTALAGRPAGRLSGGEQQRLAVAVALANRPRLLLADEPTSQLDRASAAAVIDLIRIANRDLGTTVVAVTHDPAVGSALGRTVTIRDGRVGAEGRGGRDYIIVGRDGSVQLPEDLLEVLPPGSLAEARRTADGVEIRPVRPDDDGESRRSGE
jgi:putative ABC transport system ATP-binding protein